MVHSSRQFLILQNFKMHHWFKSYGDFANRVVELHQEGSVIKGASLYSLSKMHGGYFKHFLQKKHYCTCLTQIVHPIGLEISLNKR